MNHSHCLNPRISTPICHEL